MVRGRAVAIVALLALAGCQGLDSGGETVTPAPVPTASGEGAGDANPIADTHRRALTNQSYTTVVRLTVIYPNGTDAQLDDRFAVRPDDSYRYERRVDEPYPQDVSNFTIWQNRSTEFRRTTAPNGTTTVTVSDTSGLADRTFAGFLRRILSGFDRSVRRYDDRRVVSGEQNGPLTVPLPTALQNGRNATLDAEIRDGIVRSLSVRARADGPDDEPVTVLLYVAVERIGGTYPSRPAWANESAAGG